MGLFSRITRIKKPKLKIVGINFRDLSSDRELSEYGLYKYLWTFEKEPEIGMWVYINGSEGKTTGRIAAVNLTPESGLSMSRVLSIVEEEVVKKARAQKVSDFNLWLDRAAKIAGIKMGKISSRKLKEEIPPATGQATKSEAAKYGNTWWRIYKKAEEAGRPKEQVDAFRKIAFRWYAIRDREK